MKGDFSWFDHRAQDNYTGVLEQQGRVRLDRDGLAAEEIGRHLRNLMGRDAFGPGRVSVPAEASESLRVTAAETDGDSVRVTVQPGRAWIDGIPFLLPQELVANAAYLGDTVVLEADPEEIATGVRDAVVLEIWEDSVSAFQEPGRLLEPALGGVDTTERVKIYHRLRLRRLDDDEDCGTIDLRDDPADRGRLTATPSPTIAIAGDCPVEAGGGYTGDGHILMCVEIARTVPAGPRFVWSRHGGGLVGRGRFDATEEVITITHNMPMIAAAGVAGFHLQALEPDPDTGEWGVRFEATVSFDGEGGLSVTDPVGTWPAVPGETAFFRIWDGIEDIADFDGGPTDLADGIRLEFDPATPTNYREGDRWFFQARAAGTTFDPSEWPDQAPPVAIRYHRAPLAILEWSSAPPDNLTAPEGIEDCRDGFPPLTDPCHCCTITVGDGVRTHGDTDSIEEAIDRLPARGGRICLLPGRHQTNALISERADITISGCGKQSQVIPRLDALDAPIFEIADSECITLENMDMVSLDGVAIFATSSDDDALRQLTIRDCRILACARAIQIEGGSETVITDNRIRMLDKPGAGVAVYLTGEDARIEDNDIGVVPAEATPVPPDGPDDFDNPDDPTDPCADPVLIYLNPGFYFGLVEFLFGFNLTAIVPPPYNALGGIQIGAESERVAVIDNRILGGAGNGITLGGSHRVVEVSIAGEDDTFTLSLPGPVLAVAGGALAPEGGNAVGATIRMTSPSGQTRAAVTDSIGQFQIEGTLESGPHTFEAVDQGLGVENVVLAGTNNLGQGTLVQVRVILNRTEQQTEPAFGFLYEIRIEDNEITAMGLNGIGTPPPVEVLGDPPDDDDGDGDPADQPDIVIDGGFDGGPQAGGFDVAGNNLAAFRPRREIDPGSLAEARRFSNARAAAVVPVLARLGHPVIDLTILNNRIIGNLQTPFTAAMRDYARDVGLGGISLGLCETVTIMGNRVESNGLRYVDPVCGIFVRLGEQVEVTDNLIRDNGPFVQVDADIERGERGGIAGIFLAIGPDDLVNDNIQPLSKPALRLHDNVIEQPLGRALTAIAAGPVSIVSNHMSAERNGFEPTDLMAGAAMVLNLGGANGLPSGGILCNSNQLRLGPNAGAFAAVVMGALQDVGLDANQIDAQQIGLVNPNQTSMLNTFLIGATTHATGNRFTERALGSQSAQVSMISLSNLMGLGTTNIADHCIFVNGTTGTTQIQNVHNLIGEEFVIGDIRCQDIQGAAQGAAALPVFGVLSQVNADVVAVPGQQNAVSQRYAMR